VSYAPFICSSYKKAKKKGSRKKGVKYHIDALVVRKEGVKKRRKRRGQVSY